MAYDFLFSAIGRDFRSDEKSMANTNLKFYLDLKKKN